MYSAIICKSQLTILLPSPSPQTQPLADSVGSLCPSILACQVRSTNTHIHTQTTNCNQSSSSAFNWSDDSNNRQWKISRIISPAEFCQYN